MNLTPLKIGNLVARLPIIQGGMGVGVSLSGLASAVTNAGGIGIISSAQIGFKENDFDKNPLEANLRALKKHIKLAKEKCNNGIIGVNVMVATKEYAEYIKTAVESGIDLIISGAGMPTMLPKLTKGYNVKIAPIVSSLKAAKVILKLWDKHDNVAPDMIVVEGPKAGGHLGFKKDEIETASENFDTTIVDIVNHVKEYEEKYEKKIPIIAAGGIFDGSDIAKYLNLGASGVQMATRFVATHECDASLEFKNAYVNANKDEVGIVSSPVGMPGRAILNPFVNKTKEGPVKVDKCFRCLTPCDPKTTPYCITKALINSVNGDIDNGLIFCGENVSKIKEITSVKSLMAELENEIKAI
ncbi:2-nitropropane dioxygenase [Clostridium baratii]|uniref:NAD(P)H-dependent flavin oxidoreductase n=1 Tax=Clostridium baratii TaxID=1561 RepID=UPI0009A26879|nr:nitronate monooxygenase [Clostridium baratii]OPF52790.1 2-nitropropane dioxygenase [Clostridium baratii]OPF56239.1 2-nitropropane dioxygenase [Clostridium baratii]OPF58166.1 2-nitropropane dioxygenase [Clostridium baratii]OPF59379.1 2-nitropropane dioxygenase [Clostridium baratii]